MEIEKKVIGIISKILNVKPEEITLETGIGDFPKWDSLANLSILQTIQDEFEIEIEPEEIIELEDVNDIISIVTEKVK